MDEPVRTKVEIAMALAQLRDCLAGAKYNRDEGMVQALSATMEALYWVLREDRPGGFGAMLRDLDEVDRRNNETARN